MLKEGGRGEERWEEGGGWDEGKGSEEAVEGGEG